MRAHRWQVVVGATVLALALAGCSGGGGDDGAVGADGTPSAPAPASASGPATAPTTAGPSASLAPDDDRSTTSPVLEPGAVSTEQRGTASGDTGSTALLRAVRVAGQPGFDRVVFEFTGSGTPEYVARYVDPPVTEDASGNEVDVRGKAFLAVTMLGASGVDMSGPTFRIVYTGPKRLSAGDTAAVQEVVETGDFEATLTWVTGVDARQPFTVVSLLNPARLVVDVRAPA